jgi:hypothetical protein
MILGDGDEGLCCRPLSNIPLARKQRERGTGHTSGIRVDCIHVNPGKLILLGRRRDLRERFRSRKGRGVISSSFRARRIGVRLRCAQCRCRHRHRRRCRCSAVIFTFRGMLAARNLFVIIVVGRRRRALLVARTR